MPLILFYTRRVREAVSKPATIGVELIFLALVATGIGLFFLLGRQMSIPFHEKTVISLSFTALPKYTLLSLSRGFAAYILSLIFTLCYGTFAAHNHRAERVMIPALDVLQAIPVLGFLPGLVIAMVSLFPKHELGLELACVIMIFTAQVWNMTFSFHGSLRGIAQPLREVAALQRLSSWQIFRKLELPSAMIGLVWNSMMSMAGGWFFLTVNEAFTLENHDFRLPGIGSYMNEAINQKNIPAMIAAIVAMTVMIVAVDRLFWRPIVVWAQRFKLEDTAEADKPQSWLLNLLSRSMLYRAMNFGIAVLMRRIRKSRKPTKPLANSTPPRHFRSPLPAGIAKNVGRWIAFMGLGWIALWGAITLLGLLIKLPLHQDNHEDWLHVLLALLASFGRTTAAVILSAAWTLPVGILIGRSQKWSQRLQPIIQVVASFPAPMVFPLVTLLLVVLHIPFTVGCVALMLLGAQWYILFNVIAGASSIPGDLKEVTSIYRLDRWQRWTRLYLPCVFPYLVTGLVTAAGGAWNATIVSEFVQVHDTTYRAFGLGSMISAATASGNNSLLAAGVVSMALFVVLLNRLIWKRLYRLSENRYGLLS